METRRVTRKMWAAGIALVIGAAGIVIYILFQVPRTAAVVPAAIVESAGYPIIVPSSLPEGYRIDEESFQHSEETLLFNAVNKNGERIVFSEQATPNGYDFESFHSKVLKDSRTVLGATYKAWVGKSEGNTWLLSVPTDKTWVIVTSRTSTGLTDLEYVARQLKKL